MRLRVLSLSLSALCLRCVRSLGNSVFNSFSALEFKGGPGKCSLGGEVGNPKRAMKRAKRNPTLKIPPPKPTHDPNGAHSDYDY